MNLFLSNTPLRATITGLLTAVALLCVAKPSNAQSFHPLPFPVLAYGGTETYHVDGQVFIRYRLPVVNRHALPNSLFEWTRARKNPSRTWVHIYDHRGRKLYGFTALRCSQDLGQLWFSVKFGERPPTAVYVELHDRLTGRRYRSNLVLLRAFR